MRRFGRGRVKAIVAVLLATVASVGGTGGVQPAVASVPVYSYADPSDAHCNNDVRSWRISYTDQSFSMAVEVACGTNVASDPGWIHGNSGSITYIDVNGDNTVDFELRLEAFWADVWWQLWPAGTWHPDWANAEPKPSCAAVTTRTASEFRSEVPSSCLGTPGSMRMMSQFVYDKDYTISHCGMCEYDSYPDSGLVAIAMTDTRPPPPPARAGYWMLSERGHLYAFGDAAHLGTQEMASTLNPAVDIETFGDGQGYWILDRRGQVYSFGNATWRGGVPAGALSNGEVATSMSARPDGRGYWIFTNRGRAFALGDAQHFGDMSGVALNGPVLGSVATPSGNGYYMVASDGGIFSFGDAAFAGSMGGQRLNRPVQGLVPDGDGRGYWLVASDGGVFAFEAPFRGSMGHVALNQPVNGMVRFGNGYLMIASDGGVFNFSDKPFFGSLGGHQVPAIIGAAAFGT